jgi:predicted Zn-dependent peptidase
MSKAIIETLANGLTVIVEPMLHLRSVAYDLSIPGGELLDLEGQVGGGSITQELVTRGAAGIGAFELSNRFDEAGISHGEGAGFDRVSFTGACLPTSLRTGLGLIADMVMRPTLDEAEVASIKAVMVQDISSIPDSPSRHASLAFEQEYFSPPFNRPSCGRLADIEEFTGGGARATWERLYRPDGACLSIAGNIDPSEVISDVKQLFADWRGTAGVLPRDAELQSGRAYFVPSPSEQVQIVLGYPSAPFLSEHYYAARVVNVVLSGGMFGRLFVEVREKRGLCYSVHSSHIGQREFGYVRAYAGTTPDRAKTTLEVMTSELGRVEGTVSAEELERAKGNLRASLVMGLESPISRASANLSEWWMKRRVRSIEEIEAAVDRVDEGAIDRYVATFSPAAASVLTLGPEPLLPDSAEVTLGAMLGVA